MPKNAGQSQCSMPSAYGVPRADYSRKPHLGTLSFSCSAFMLIGVTHKANVGEVESKYRDEVPIPIQWLHSMAMDKACLAPGLMAAALCHTSRLSISSQNYRQAVHRHWGFSLTRVCSLACVRTPDQLRTIQLQSRR